MIILQKVLAVIVWYYSFTTIFRNLADLSSFLNIFSFDDDACSLKEAFLLLAIIMIK